MKLEKFSAFDPKVLNFLEEHSHTFFLSKPWLYALQEGFPYPVLCYALSEGETVLLVLPGMLFNLKIATVYHSNIPYGGFVGDHTLIPQFLELFELEAKRAGIHQIRVAKTVFDDFPPLEGYAIQKGHQHIVNVEGMTEESLWVRYKKRVRRDIRKAEKSGVEIEEMKGPDEASMLFEIYLETMERNGAVANWNSRILQFFLRELFPQGWGTGYFAKKGGKPIAAIVLFYSKEVVHLFIGGSKAEYFEYCPNDLLMHRGILEAIRRGKKYFDFMQSPLGDEDLTAFKDKWGTESHPFIIYEKDIAPFRAMMWRKSWKMANTKWFSSLFNRWISRK
jgi:hypothetical protein